MSAGEMDLFYRALPLASHLGSLNEVDDQDKDQGLELGLSLGGAAPRSKAWRRDGDNGDDRTGAAASKGWGDRCRILIAGDFPSPGHRPATTSFPPPPPASSPAASTSSVSSSSSSLAAAAGRPGSGTKRHAEAAAPETRSNTPGQVVVGWPPIRAYRVNNLVNHLPKDNNSTKETQSATRGADSHMGCSNNGASAQEIAAAMKEPEKRKTSAHLVKVNMDGMAIGRKVDLTAHASYNALALALEDMFQNTPTTPQIKKTSKLLDGSSEFVLTYEDKDGDWMLVGDVPWGMFLNSVRRLRIMRTSDANVLAPGQLNTSGV